MRTLTLLVALVALPALPATSQDVDTPEGTPIRAAEVSGVPFDQLSPELRGEITALAGVPLSRERLRELATRIEAEQPETVAAVRSVALQDGGVRVVFLVARISEDSDLLANINARYVVESVEISGIDETTIREDVLDELQTSG
jgi:hypothetical protein